MVGNRTVEGNEPSCKFPIHFPIKNKNTFQEIHSLSSDSNTATLAVPWTPFNGQLLSFESFDPQNTRRPSLYRRRTSPFNKDLSNIIIDVYIHLAKKYVQCNLGEAFQVPNCPKLKERCKEVHGACKTMQRSIIFLAVGRKLIEPSLISLHVLHWLKSRLLFTWAFSKTSGKNLSSATARTCAILGRETTTEIGLKQLRETVWYKLLAFAKWILNKPHPTTCNQLFLFFPFGVQIQFALAVLSTSALRNMGCFAFWRTRRCATLWYRVALAAKNNWRWHFGRSGKLSKLRTPVSSFWNTATLAPDAGVKCLPCLFPRTLHVPLPNKSCHP